jgi:tRNA A-37 threonylcarbamoyl transferase component Bud32
VLVVPGVSFGAIPGYNRWMREGDVIDNGRYRVEKPLGQGGMGQVFRGFDTQLNKAVAIKVLLPNTPDSVIKRFHAEAVALAALNHPNILTVHHFGQAENGQLYLIMDFIKGETLGEMIEKRGAQTFFDVLPIFEKICRGLRYAHLNNVLHRDIKPSNVMLAADRTKDDSVKLVDFGLAKQADKDFELTKVGSTMGSPLYMSPEAVKGTESDARSDIYSLGCTLFEMLTGAPPLVGETPFHTMMAQVNRLAPSLSEASGKSFDEEVELFVAKCLKKSPNDRFQNMDELIAGLERVKSDLNAKKEFSLNALASGVYASGSYLAGKALNADKNLLGTGIKIAIVGVLIVAVAAFFGVFNSKEPVAVVHTDESLAELGRSVDKKRVAEKVLALDQVSDEGEVMIVRGLPNQNEQTCFIRGKFSDEDLEKQLAPHRDKKSWKLEDVKLSDKSMEFILAQPSIERLQLSHVTMTPQMFELIPKMPKLQHLLLYRTNPPPGFLESLQSKQLLSIDLDPGKNYTHVGAALSKIKSLRMVWLRDAQVNRDDIREIAGGLRLDLFSIGKCKFTLDALDDLKLAKHCTVFCSTNMHLEPQHIKGIAGLPFLGTLDLHGTNADDNSLRMLQGCKYLKMLIVTDTKVTERGVALLKTSIPELTNVYIESQENAYAEIY